jgi:hypothetical protein
VRQSCPCNPLPIGEGFLVGRAPRRRRHGAHPSGALHGAPEQRTRAAALAEPAAAVTLAPRDDRSHDRDPDRRPEGADQDRAV